MFEVRDTMPDTEVSWSRSEVRAPMGWGSSAMVYQHRAEGGRYLSFSFHDPRMVPCSELVERGARGGLRAR
jgi:hypothetical protein